ncbi:hypothetical protein [Streptomyces sp. MMS24-I29]|uniref:hypothetical protein n=1 Tax=Streptomyces sp. MMS24-I29 TaxID=3351480 RepID=UPI003C7EB6C9
MRYDVRWVCSTPGRADDVDPELVLFALGGLLHIHVTHIGTVLSAETVVRAVDLALTGIGPRTNS